MAWEVKQHLFDERAQVSFQDTLTARKAEEELRQAAHQVSCEVMAAALVKMAEARTDFINSVYKEGEDLETEKAEKGEEELLELIGIQFLDDTPVTPRAAPPRTWVGSPPVALGSRWDDLVDTDEEVPVEAEEAAEAKDEEVLSKRQRRRRRKAEFCKSSPWKGKGKGKGKEAAA